MKHSPFSYLLTLVLLAIVSGCAPTAPTASSELIPPAEGLDVVVDLVGPEMKVGASWLYADGTLIVPVPTGKSIQGHGGADDPQIEVDLSDYWIYSTEVTNVQYAHCVRMGACTPPYSPDNPGFHVYLYANDPVVGVDYKQANDYCTFVAGRVPTEAEWEKAARGPDARSYPWGEDPPTCGLLNYMPCVGSASPVNAYPDGRSYYGAFDMAGNVYEWVFDRYQSDSYLSALAEDPQGPEKGSRRVVRSSAFNSGANQTQVYNRFHSDPVDHRDNLGFRCVVEDPLYFASFCEYPAVYGTNGIGGASAGESIEVQCPEWSIEQTPTCVGTFSMTFVNIEAVSLPNPLIYPVDLPSTCEKSVGGQFEFACTGNGEFTLCGGCNVSLTTPPQCPTGYSYDTDSKFCVGQGSPGTCFPGSTPVTTTNGICCSFTAGTGAPTAAPASAEMTQNLLPSQNCPAGTWQSSNSECVSVPVEDPYCVTEGVVLNSCTSGGGGGDGEPPPQGCPAQSCGTNYAWDPDSCSCVCDGC